MSSEAAGTTQERFYADLTALLRELKPGEVMPDPDPDTHLWANGYLDSVGLLEVIYFLEDRMGREIELIGDFLPHFFTLESIWRTYVDTSETVPGGR
ncbi:MULTISPECIES: acyl carrier protein [unclassified Micromonospora]|uniref:acyl carrier protein n=1 Tax=unclassified Micromonospora TaxID=2617518 RepID=UPI002FF11DC1